MQIPQQQLITLAQKYQTPLYVYDGDLIKKRYHELYKFIPYNKLKIYYAMKANYNLAILKLLEQENARIDAVSPGDVPALAEAMLELASNAGLRQQLSANGLSHAASFSWARTAEQTREAYRDALAMA